MFPRLKVPAVLGFAVAVMLAAPPAADAQVTATVVTKDGERHTGRNLGYRVDEREVAVRTSQHEEPRIPVNRVAYIDFGGAADTKVDITGSQEAVVMRDGRVLKGQVTEIGHENRADESTPYLIVFRTETGDERRLSANEVGRVYFAGGATAVPTTGTGTTAGDPAQGITVSGQQQWTATGISVRQGEWITLNTSGEIRLSDDANDIATPDGSKAQRRDPRAPMPNVLAGALIGRVGNGQPFGIGTQTRIQVPATGQLFLGINDSHLADNQGSFQVQIQREAPVRRR